MEILTKKQLNRKVKQDFLLSFFDKDEYTEKEINGFWLLKQYNGDTGNWQVAIYSKESYKNYKGYGESKNTKSLFPQNRKSTS